MAQLHLAQKAMKGPRCSYTRTVTEGKHFNSEGDEPPISCPAPVEGLAVRSLSFLVFQSPGSPQWESLDLFKSGVDIAGLRELGASRQHLQEAAVCGWQVGEQLNKPSCPLGCPLVPILWTISPAEQQRSLIPQQQSMFPKQAPKKWFGVRQSCRYSTPRCTPGEGYIVTQRVVMVTSRKLVGQWEMALHQPLSHCCAPSRRVPRVWPHFLAARASICSPGAQWPLSRL